MDRCERVWRWVGEEVAAIAHWARCCRGHYSPAGLPASHVSLQWCQVLSTCIYLYLSPSALESTCVEVPGFWPRPTPPHLALPFPLNPLCPPTLLACGAGNYRALVEVLQSALLVCWAAYISGHTARTRQPP